MWGIQRNCTLWIPVTLKTTIWRQKNSGSQTTTSKQQGDETHQGWEPKPYQASCRIWKPRPRRIVFLFPMDLIRIPNTTVCRATQRSFRTTSLVDTHKVTKYSIFNRHTHTPVVLVITPRAPVQTHLSQDRENSHHSNEGSNCFWRKTDDLQETTQGSGSNCAIIISSHILQFSTYKDCMMWYTIDHTS